MDNGIEVGQVVTWGSGAPRGKVMEVEGDQARVKLLKALDGLCGKEFFRAGLEAWFPAVELRVLQ